MQLFPTQKPIESFTLHTGPATTRSTHRCVFISFSVLTGVSSPLSSAFSKLLHFFSPFALRYSGGQGCSTNHESWLYGHCWHYTGWLGNKHACRCRLVHSNTQVSLTICCLIYRFLSLLFCWFFLFILFVCRKLNCHFLDFTSDGVEQVLVCSVCSSRD